MADIRIVQVASLSGVTMDWLMTPAGQLDETDELATAMIVALCSDARAHETDILPDLDSDDRRGWWGDFQAAQVWNGWPIGSRLWLLSRAKIADSNAQEGATVARAEQYTRDALQPFIVKRVASRVDVKAERVGTERIDVSVVMYRGPLPAVSLQFQFMWDGVGQ